MATTNNDYNVKIIDIYDDTNITLEDKIAMKLFSDNVSINAECESVPDKSIVIPVQNYAVMRVHNERSDNKDYNVYCLISTDGTHYTTSSESFWNTFSTISDELKDNDINLMNTPIYLKCLLKPSKNRQGKDFLTCSIVSAPKQEVDSIPF